MCQNLINIIDKFQESYLDYLKFIVKLLFWVLILFFGLPFLAKLFTSLFKINIQLNDFILLITAAFIIAYTYETQKMKEQVIKQTELEQMPVMVMYVRNIRDYMADPANFDEQERVINKFQDYLIRIRTEGGNSDYFINLRNTGKGTAFNMKIESDIFEVSKYKSQFFAPLKDEHSIAIIKKDNKKIESWDELNGSIFKIYCNDVIGQSYCFKYKIIDIENKKVEFMGIEKD